MARIPAWYNKKLPTESYLEHGQPLIVQRDELCRIEGWIDPTAEEVDMWETDARDVILGKHKKKQFMITPSEVQDCVPRKNANGLYTLRIQVLHLDHQGFVYSDEDTTVEGLNRKFWPVVSKLLAHFVSPKIRARPYTEAEN